MRRALFLVLMAMLVAGSTKWPLTCSRVEAVPDCCKGGVCMMKMHQDADGACLCSASSITKDMVVAVRAVLAVSFSIAKPDFTALVTATNDASHDGYSLLAGEPPRWSADVRVRTSRA